MPWFCSPVDLLRMMATELRRTLKQPRNMTNRELIEEADRLGQKMAKLTEEIKKTIRQLEPVREVRTDGR